MFSENKKEKQTFETSGTSQNVISHGTKIVGDLISKGGFRVDGIVEGNLKTTGKVVVGKEGYIKGTLDGSDAYFDGRFSGKLRLSGTLTLKSSAHIEGDVVVGKLAVEPGATFNVNCLMKGAVKEMKNGEQTGQQKAQAGKSA